MKINGLTDSITWQQSPKKKNISTTNETSSPQISEQRTLVRELAKDLDPKNMSRNDALDLANKLMRVGEADLSSIFLPAPPFRRENDGSITDLRGTPEGDAIMNKKANIIEQVTNQIEYRKSKSQPTKLHEDALNFLNQLQLTRTNKPIDAHA